MKMTKDFVILIIFISCINYIAVSKLAWLVVTTIVVVYGITYLRLKKRVKHFEEIANERLKLQNEYFSETLMHDFKIPLLAQLRGIELLSREALGTLNAEQHELINNIEYSCKDILSMIGMVVKTYHLENNSLKLEYEKFNLAELIKSCFDEVSKQACEKNLTLEYSSTEKDTTIEADKKAIKRVIINLLTNAIGYSTIGGSISVKIRSENSQIMFTLSGMGLGSSSWNFTKYNRKNKFTTIGLNVKMYLCKKIIEFHKGKIYTQKNNRFPNTLTFVIPKHAINLIS